MKASLKIVYMGTAEFAVPPLELLIQNGYTISAVITASDKPSGRGLRMCQSPVFNFAKRNNLRILQPENLKDPNFIEELKDINPDLQIVVAFRMLPEVVWKLPRLGTFNLHASLLPQYRGAAPINRAIMNGETKTGVTTFFINETIDTGNILLQQETAIDPDECAGQLHDRLMQIGSETVLKTVRIIEQGTVSEISQSSKMSKEKLLSPAPKIFKEDCAICWNDGIDQIYNHIRGLSPYPAATTELISPEGIPYYIKVFRSRKNNEPHAHVPGKLMTDGRSFVSIAVAGGTLNLEEIQLRSKNKMMIDEFLRGFPMNEHWSVKLV